MYDFGDWLGRKEERNCDTKRKIFLTYICTPDPDGFMGFYRADVKWQPDAVSRYKWLCYKYLQRRVSRNIFTQDAPFYILYDF